MGFPFLFAVCAVAMFTITFVDIEKGREDCRKFVEERKISRGIAESGISKDAIIKGPAEGDLGVGTSTSDG